MSSRRDITGATLSQSTGMSPGATSIVLVQGELVPVRIAQMQFTDVIEFAVGAEASYPQTAVRHGGRAPMQYRRRESALRKACIGGSGGPVAETGSTVLDVRRG